MGVKAISYSMLVLRVLTLLLLIASAVCMFRNTYKLDGEKTTWKDLRTYRYVFAIAIIGAFYTLIQLPFAIYYAYTQKRLIRHWLLPEFDFYADKLISYILATGVGAGFAASVELKAFLDEVVVLIAFIFLAENKKVDLGYSIDEFHNRVHKYLDRGIIATVLLTLGFACMAVTSILSSLSRPKSGSQSRFIFG